MGRPKKSTNSEPIQTGRPALTPDGRERQCISLAMDLVERRLREGTASSAEVCHFLKLGSSKERLEREILEEQKKLVIAKTDGLASQKRSEEFYAEVIRSMKEYSGNLDEEDE